jgi:large subunit ribosomal protein L1
MKRSKRYETVATDLEVGKEYPAVEAVKLVKKMANAKFNETIEFVANLGVDPRHADQMVRGTVVLPHGTGKTKRILVFAEGDKAREAEEAGADFVGSGDMVEKIQGGWIDFDVALATPDQMRNVGKLGKVLGPKGLMPNPKTGTVTNNIAQAVEEFKGGKIEYRVDRGGVIHSLIGKAEFDENKLLANAQALYEAIVKAKPTGAKGTYIKQIFIKSTMSPSVQIEHATLKKD